MQKFTREFLESLDMCKYGINHYLDNPKLYELKKGETSFTTNNHIVYGNIRYFLSQYKKHIISELKYIDNNNSYWLTSKYDKQGNEMGWNDSDGMWYKYSYDSEGTLIDFDFGVKK